MDNNTAISIRDIWKTYYVGENTLNVLRGVSIDIEKGEFVSIVGKSGSGKTTLVNQIGCLDTPTKGSIYLDNNDVSKLSESELAQIRGLKIGYVFQKFNLIKTLSAQQNVELPLIFQGTQKDEREERAVKLLKEFDMQERLLNKPSELSGGQQQRVAIARALANDPDIILADEPTGNLDSKTGITVMEYLKSLHNRGKTIILVTHDDKLSHYGQRIITLVDGVITNDIKNKNSKQIKND